MVPWRHSHTLLKSQGLAPICLFFFFPEASAGLSSVPLAGIVHMLCLSCKTMRNKLDEEPTQSTERQADGKLPLLQPSALPGLGQPILSAHPPHPRQAMNTLSLP